MTLFVGADSLLDVFTAPLRDGCDALHCVSGYASPNMVYELLALPGGDRLSLNLTVGMVAQEGVALGAHRGFLALCNDDARDRVRVRYHTAGRAIHSKVYVWLRLGEPRAAFVGSANFTGNGLLGGLGEVLVPADPHACFRYVTQVFGAGQDCNDPALNPNLVVLPPVPVRGRRAPVVDYRPWRADNHPSVDVSLLSDRTDSGVSYGLNWGQRGNRNPNQAYLPVPADVAHAEFFPPRGQRFTLLWPDGRAVSAVIAQDGDKAIQTPDSNALLGELLRHYLGVPAGAPITAEDLQRASATSYTAFRLDEETYAIEFSEA